MSDTSKAGAGGGTAGPALSVVIPVYRSAATLPRLVERLSAVLDGLGIHWELVLVDDGSPDGTWPAVEEVARRLPARVTAVQLMRNYGQHNALMCGFRQARGDLIVTMDDDLQNPPEEIPRLLDAMTEDLDVLYGVSDERRHRRWRNRGSALIGFLFRMLFGVSTGPSAFRLLRRRVVDCILGYASNFVFVDGLLAWSTDRIGSIPVRHDARAEGRSGYSPWKLVVLAVDLFTSFSLFPLQVVSYLGLGAAGLGLTLGAYYLMRSLVTGFAVPGYASTIVAVFALGGVQLLSLGVIGEYLGRLHLNVNAKPQYHVRRLLALSSVEGPDAAGPFAEPPERGPVRAGRRGPPG